MTDHAEYSEAFMPSVLLIAMESDDFHIPSLWESIFNILVMHIFVE